MKIVIDGIYKKEARPDTALVKLVAKVRLLKVELEDGIVEDILAGHRPEDLTARNLKYLSNLLTNWKN